MLDIKVLGPGCANCVKVETVARNAVANLAVEARITKITDFNEIRRYQIIATPGLVINEKVVCAGRIPGEGEVISWMADALQAS